MVGNSVARLLLLLLGTLVAMLVGSTVHITLDARDRHAHADLVERLTAADRVLFHAVVDVRSQVPRGQTALLRDDDPGSALAQARDAAETAVADALAVLAAAPLDGRAGLVEELTARRDAVTASRSMLDEQGRRPRGERELRATEPWRQAVFALADSLSSASVAVGNTVRLKDPAIGELIDIRWSAWRIRDSYGYQCSALRLNIDRGEPPDDALAAQWHARRGAAAAAWQRLDDLLARSGVPDAITARMAAARADTAAAQTRIDAVVRSLGGSSQESGKKSGRPAMESAEWTALCNGPFDAILAVGFTALDEAAAHAGRVQARTRIELAAAGTVLALALVLGLATTVILRRRLSTPIAALAGAMHSLAHGRLDVAVPCAGRNDELGAIGRGMAAVIDVLHGLREEMHRLSGRAPSGAPDTGPRNFEGAFADMAALMRGTRHAFGEIGTHASQVAVAAGQAHLAVAQVSGGAVAQTADLEAVAASVGETVRAIAHVSDSVRDASDEVRVAADFAVRGKEDMARLRTLSRTIGENARSVRQITDSISELVEVTNILSLNASIEAARAGTQGRGFAVVAEEVGKLAETAGESARRVREIVDAAGALAEEGIGVTEATWRMMDDLASRVARLDAMVQSIAAAMEQQRMTIAAIDGNIGNVRTVAQANAVASEQIAATMQQLARIAEETRTQVARFQPG